MKNILSMQASDIPTIIEGDDFMMNVLRAVRSLSLPDWWIGAGFVRNKVWDILSGDTKTPPGDIDVVYFDASDLSEETEKRYQQHLEEIFPTGKWSVTNQARMHEENGDDPYTSSLDAIAHWPETATAIAVTLNNENRVIFQAPCGSKDLLAMIIRPTPCFAKKEEVFLKRVEKKAWDKKWSKVQILSA
jgi:hypothetical protein